LSGKAYGLKKEPLTNPRLIWNFGDGATAEGTSVLHTYTLPGTYGVFLDVASGEYSASDKTVVTIVPATLTISNVVLGDSGYITISNGSPVDLDLSRWYLRDGSVLFLLPSHTVVSARGALTIPNSVSKLFVTNSGVELLYPNGEVEYHFTQPTASQSPTQTPVIATKPTVLKKTVASKKAVSIASTPLNNSQMAGVAASEAPARGARSEVLSVTRKSDSVALWMLGLSGFIGAVFFGMWFVHKKSLVELSEAKLEGGEEEDEEEFEIIP
jgi:PKD repeat protein